jgi:hypothetical protein
MNAQDLELKIAGLEKAIKEHKDFTGTYEDDLKQTQKQLEDYNKPEITPLMMDEVNDAIDKVIRKFDFTDTDNYDIDFELDYDNKISISNIEFNSSDNLCQEIVDKVQDLFKEVPSNEEGEVDNN